MTTSHAARSLAIVALLCIGAGACGGSKSNSSSAAPSTTNAGNTAPGNTAPGVTTATVPVKASGSGGGFCKLESDSLKKAQSAVTGGAGMTAAALRTQYSTLRQTEQPAIDSAPAELKSDLNLLLDASVKYGQELAKVDYDVTRAPATATAAFSAAPVRTASTHVLTYLKQTCGIDFGAGATPPTAAP